MSAAEVDKATALRSSPNSKKLRKTSQFQAPTGPQRRISRDIVSALTRLELVRGKASEALHELKRQRSGDATDGGDESRGSEVLAEGDEHGDVSFQLLQEQLEEIKGVLRETKGELAQVSYRAEVLESERRKYRQRVAVLEKRLKGKPSDSWELVSLQQCDKELSSRQAHPTSKDTSRPSSASGSGPLAATSGQDSGSSRPSSAGGGAAGGDDEESLSLAAQLLDRDQVIERIKHQLDFYAGELRSKVEREQQLLTLVEESNARCRATEEQLDRLEDRFEDVQEECMSMRTHREGVLRLAERCMTEAQQLGEASAARHNLERLVTSRDAVINDVVVRCALVEEQVKSLRATCSKLSTAAAQPDGGGNDNDRRTVAMYREEVAWLKSCLLRQFLERQADKTCEPDAETEPDQPDATDAVQSSGSNSSP